MDQLTISRLVRLGVDERRIAASNIGDLELAKADLSGCDLRGCNVARTNFENANFFGSDVRGLVFSSSNCVSAWFVGADMRGANLSFGYFHNADFSGADMRGCRVIDSLCNECCFAGADLRGAVFGFEHYDSDFRGADLRGAVIPEDCDFDRLNCDISSALFSPRGAAKIARNKRVMPRIQLARPLKVYDRNTSLLAGSCIDITHGGLRLLTEQQLTVGSKFSLQLLLPARTGAEKTLDLEAKAAWCKPATDNQGYHTGFQTIAMAEQGKAVIDYLIKNYQRKNT